jgi:hypothetical protein
MPGPTSDPFEEFEFQPLTEGLGFHQKSGQKTAAPAAPRASEPVKAQQPVARTANTNPLETKRSATQSISELMASLPPSLDFLDEKPDLSRKQTAAPVSAQSAPSIDRPQIFQPIAREEFKTPITTPAAPVTGNALPTPGTKASASTFAMTPGTTASPYRDRMSESFAKSFPRIDTTTAKAPETAEQLTPVAAGISSGIVDTMMITGVATVLLVCILQITKINLIGMLSNATTDGPTQMNLALLFLAVYHLYMLVSRAFFGATLGEWAFELQLGSTPQQERVIYPVQVILRSMLMMITGFVLIPLLSVVFNTDLAKYLTGVQLYRHS